MVIRAASQRYDASYAMGANGRRRSTSYNAGEIDELFAVLGCGRLFRIPIEALTIETITLPGRYEPFEVAMPVM
jgi:hypothetical protein